MIRMTLDCVRPTQSSVIQTIQCNVGLKCFFSILPKCLFVIIVINAYFIDISQGSVKMHLRCGRICNNHVIANCPQTVPVKEFRKSINNLVKIWTKAKCHVFFGTTCTSTNARCHMQKELTTIECISV